MMHLNPLVLVGAVIGVITALLVADKSKYVFLR